MNVRLELDRKKGNLESNADNVNYESEHLQTLYEALSKYEDFIIEAEEIAIKEFKFNNGIIEVENIQRERRKVKKIKEKTLEHFLNKSSQYRLAIKKYEDTKCEINIVEKNYKDANLILKSIEDVETIYSKTTESMYVEVKSKDFFVLINNISKCGKRFVVSDDNLLNEESFKIRFSTHAPNGFKEIDGEYKLSKNSPEVIVFTNTKIVKQGKESYNYQSIANTNSSNEVEIDKKLSRAKWLSSKKIKNLKDVELKEYYDIMNLLQVEKSLSRDKFVGTFNNNVAGVLKEVDKRNIDLNIT